MLGLRFDPYYFVHHKSYMVYSGSEPARRGEKPTVSLRSR